ncbi:putative membrane protein [Lentzea flaviverrucosa]|uniref:Putative membrane protein n=1 Tax=Lentzea flaviverrucosa TaxID=200379 RepID=A0A1H9XXS9_9PSEU|nr:putative membrane protein [Lentzea flaviverrucosa]SES50483.1 putative membrane protein [Lentzea flaviverrucosa]
MPSRIGHLDSPRGRVDGKNLGTTTEAMTMNWYYGTPMGWGGFSMMALTMLLFWCGLIALVVVLVRRSPHTGPETRILRERLARGDIDTEEFERVRRTLDSR